MIKKWFNISLLGLTCLYVGQVTAQQLQPTAALKKGVLPNGLTYYIYPNSYPKGEAVYRLFVKVGSVQETEQQRGLAHFLEHIAFNGTRHFPGNSLVKFLESKGAKFGKDLNAHTSYNETVYKLKLPSNSAGMVDSTITILADWANDMLLDSSQIEDERGVVLSEWLSKTGAQQDANNSLLTEILNGSHYADRRTIGDTGVIKNFKRKELQYFYQKWYRPDLMAVAIVGDINPDEIEKLITKKMGAIPGRPATEIREYPIPDYADTKATIVTHPSLKKAELNFIQLLPKPAAINTEKAYTDYLRRTLINRLFKARLAALSFSSQDYENGSVSISNFINTKSMLYASAGLVQDKMQQSINSFVQHLEQLYQFGFTTQEIDKAKKIYSKQLLRRSQSLTPVVSEDIMNELYSDYYGGNTFVSPAEEYRLYEKYATAIDSLSIRQQLCQLVKSSPTHYLLTAPDKNTIKTEQELLRIIDEARKPTPVPFKTSVNLIHELMDELPAAGKVINIEKIDKIGATILKLSNGVTLIYKPLITGKNRINLSAFKPGGLYALDSADYVNGLFAANIISLSGVSRYTREELSHYLAGNSASARFLIEKTRSGIVGSSTLEDAETLFQLLYLRSTAAKVDTAIFNSTRDVTLQSYRNKKTTPETLFADSLNFLLNGKNYITRGLTTNDITEKLQAGKLLPIYNRFFNNANGYTYVIMSDTSLSALMPFIERYIASIPHKANSTLPYRYKGGNIRTDSTSYIRNNGSGIRASVSLVFQSIKLPKDYSGYELNSTIVEGILKMKLNSVIREQLGLVYSVGVATSSALHPSPLSRSSITFTCLPGNVDLIIKNIKEILQEMATHPEGYQNELDNVKKNLIKEWQLNQQRDLYWSTAIRNNYYNNLKTFDHLVFYTEAVNQFTPASIPGVIKQNFNSDSMVKAVLLPAKK
ncbi:M16 family metallopeptidase [Niabella sp. 22666]|uniref:M16 family metallopeptidase n=1 Tax=Niabella sp. 22666 TaxID=3453954 RepID=UPI003F861722